MHKDFSPEEKLLRLIRSKTAKQAVTPGAQTDKPIEETVKSPTVLSKTPASPLQKERTALRWENLNLILVILLIGLLLSSMPFFLKRQKNPLEKLEEKLRLQEKTAGPEIEESKRPPFDYFSQQTASRNIFSPVLKEETQTQTPAEEGPKLEEIKGQLSLLGVIGGDVPQAIIEDKRTQKTYFLNKGSTFDDIEVGDILENKVILFYKGKEFELVL